MFEEVAMDTIYNVFNDEVKKNLLKMPIEALNLPSEVETALKDVTYVNHNGQRLTAINSVEDLLKMGKEKTTAILSREKYFKQNSLTTIYACNLIPEIMYLAEFDQNTLKKKLVSFELKKEKVNTTVYSLETESHNYVADGILTHNCIYRFNGCTDQYLKDCYYNPNFTAYYLNTNYRCSPNFVSFADEIVASLDKISPPTEVARKSNGIFEKTSFLNALEECQWQGNYRQWAILCRTNAEIESVSEILAEKKIPFVTFKNSELSFQEKQELLKKDAIKLLTIHTSKGSTFDHVIVVGAKLFNVEERCISYVAATRAKYTLFWCPQFKKKRNQPKTSLSTTKKMTQKTGVKMVQF